MEEKDAVIVGARCAGSTLAIVLADRGWDALAAGAEGRFGEKVVDLIGSGTDDDPVSGGDTFSRQVDPSRVLSKERLARWFSAEPEAASL